MTDGQEGLNSRSGRAGWEGSMRSTPAKPARRPGESNPWGATVVNSRANVSSS